MPPLPPPLFDCADFFYVLPKLLGQSFFCIEMNSRNCTLFITMSFRMSMVVNFSKINTIWHRSYSPNNKIETPLLHGDTMTTVTLMVMMTMLLMPAIRWKGRWIDTTDTRSRSLSMHRWPWPSLFMARMEGWFCSELEDLECGRWVIILGSLLKKYPSLTKLFQVLLIHILQFMRHLAHKLTPFHRFDLEIYFVD